MVLNQINNGTNLVHSFFFYCSVLYALLSSCVTNVVVILGYKMVYTDRVTGLCAFKGVHFIKVE